MPGVAVRSRSWTSDELGSGPPPSMRIRRRAARSAAVQVEAMGYRTLWLNEATGRDPFVMAGLLLSATTTLNVALGHRQHLRPRRDDDRGGAEDAGRGVPGPLPPRSRGQQPRARRAGARPRLRQAVVEHAGVPRGDGRRAVQRGRSDRAAGARARRARPEDAGALGHPGRRRPPVPHHAGAHRAPHGRSSGPACCWRPSRWSCSSPTRPPPGRSGGRAISFYLRAPGYLANLRRLGFTDDDWADPKAPSDRLVDAHRGVGRRRCTRSRGSASTTTPGPTTSPCRCCAAIVSCRSTSGASSPTCCCRATSRRQEPGEVLVDRLVVHQPAVAPADGDVLAAAARRWPVRARSGRRGW